MLILKNIVKNYRAGDMKVEALRGIDLEFRKSEFVAVLGPSGCGKTTLLNIIGGLDRYSSGDLSVNGLSTKKFKDSDWDSYRNRSIGFVFQNYNLISHQSVLSNVELALTLSGVTKKERRARAIAVLEQVGLGDQLRKKPNQMSGGQMQRVAIARALINDPEILLADEPTGALDSETSTQVMAILKDIAKDRLVIMVTHNPDLADAYANRVVKLLDGRVTSDTNPYTAGEGETEKHKRVKKTSMSFFTALSLSLNNLMTKKGRTLLTAFAGSIGIIGIALILALSNGFQAFIDRVQEDTLSGYPISIEQQSVDITGMLGSMMQSTTTTTDMSQREADRIYSADIMVKMLDSLVSDITTNNIAEFKEFVEDESNGVMELLNDVKYGYPTTMQLYSSDTGDGIIQVAPNQIMKAVSGSGMGGGNAMSSMFMGSSEVIEELVGDNELLSQQYEILTGRLPEAINEVVLLVNSDQEISDFTLYSIGLKDRQELRDVMQQLMSGEEVESLPVVETSYSYDELLGLSFRLPLNTDFYQKQTDGTWKDMSANDDYMREMLDNALEIKVVGIAKPAVNAAISSSNGTFGYLSGLNEYLVNGINNSEIVTEQLANPDVDVFTGTKFLSEEERKAAASQPAEIDFSAMSEEQRNYLMSLSEEERAAVLAQFAPVVTDATYEENIALLGVADLNDPESMRLYPKDFAAKEQLTEIIAQYNSDAEAAGKPENVIRYTDLVGLMMSSVSTIIDAISYVLIAFVAISLVVSSIMIGIITYISVLERTKEIGILRSIGASKGDISVVFIAETLIVGFTAGALGIIVSVLLTIPANAIIELLSGVANVAVLPWQGGLILVGISMALTFIAGLIPARIAAQKDPVVALRTE